MSLRMMTRAVRVLALLSLLGCARPPSAPPDAPAKAAGSAPEPSPYLAEFASEASSLGGSTLEPLQAAAGIPGDSVSAFVSIPAGRCALLAARGAPGVEDLDLYLFADDGDELATNDDPHEPATLLHCAGAYPERVLAVARIAAGRGPYALGLVDIPLGRAPAIRQRFAPGSAAERAEDFPGLDASLSAHRDMLGGSWRDLRRVLVPVDHRVPTQLDFSVEPGRCVDALVLPGDHVDDLDVDAFDEGGRAFARAEARGGERALLVCAGADPGQVALRLRPHAGRGVVLVALSEATRSSSGDLHPEFPRHDLSPGPGPLPAVPLAGRRVELAVEVLTLQPLTWSGCQRLQLEPRFPLLGYRLNAYDASGRLVAEHEGTGPGRLYLCLPKSESGPGQLQLRALSRAGPLDIESSAETPPSADLLGRAPLAASRLLGLADELGFLREASDIGQVSQHELGPDRLVRIPLLVPAERCMTVLAAVDRSGRGIEIGLVDGGTARFVDFARGARATWVRACGARGRTEDLVVELRAPYGETRALVATRQEPLRPPNAALPR